MMKLGSFYRSAPPVPTEISCIPWEEVVRNVEKNNNLYRRLKRQRVLDEAVKTVADVFSIKYPGCLDMVIGWNKVPDGMLKAIRTEFARLMTEDSAGERITR